MLLEMEKLERKHYLKHYQGGFAMVLSEGIQVTGLLEEIDMEDGSVLIKSGERSQWVDDKSVTPSLKQFKDLTNRDIETIFSNSSFNGTSYELTGFNLVRTEQLVGYASRNINLYMTKGWSVYREWRGAFTMVDNIGTIIFLLTELGYDVTGIFND